MRTVVSLGESLIDFVSSTQGTLQSSPSFYKAAGGAPAAVSACVARLGGMSAFVGKRGADAFGEFLMETLNDCGVNTRYFTPTDEAKTALAFVSLDDDGDRSFEFYRNPSADMLLHESDVPVEFIAECGVLHVGSVSLSAGPARAATQFAVREAKRRGVFVSYDPNWRPSLWADETEGLAMIRSIYDDCDLIKVNREELVLLSGTDELNTGAEYFHGFGIGTVLITLDKDGCYYSHRDQTNHTVFSEVIPGLPVQCVDTTGAGDTFIGAFLYQLAQTDTCLEEQTLKEWVRFAVSASALVTTKKGSIPSLPTLQEVQEFARNEAGKWRV